MSAYGAITTRRRPAEPLASTVWLCKPRAEPDAPTHLTLHHLTLAGAGALPGLVPYLHACFAAELERGMTYPQEIVPGEPYTQALFEGYFFAADVVVAIVGQGSAPGADGTVAREGVEAVRNGRSWEECVAGVYYVKPNYPGRSSHARLLLLHRGAAILMGGGLDMQCWVPDSSCPAREGLWLCPREVVFALRAPPGLRGKRIQLGVCQQRRQREVSLPSTVLFSVLTGYRFAGYGRHWDSQRPVSSRAQGG